MCGILGVAGRRAFGAEAFGEALDTLASRGPDDRGLYEGPRCLLGHRRLAILDLSPAGHQPMATADGRYHLVLNGEVYSFGAHRRALAAEGVSFRSTGDAEVVLQLFAREGPACLEKLRGKFALAIWDARDQALFLARDRLGVKPLYLWRFPGGLAFASEVRALRSLPGGPSALSPDALRGYLRWGSVPEPLTLFEGVAPLAPGRWARWRDGELEEAPYWELPGGRTGPRGASSGGRLAFEEAAEALRPHLREAVALRCISDAPLGLFLSGGVDSSAVAGLMRDAGQGGLRTLSVSFPGTPLDEGPYARAVAGAFGADHTDIPLGEEDVRRELDGFFARMDQPTCDGLNVYLIALQARACGLSAVLTGTGGDEVFAGYDHFRRSLRLAPWLGALPPLGGLAARWGRSHPFSRRAKLEALSEPWPLAERLYGLGRRLFTETEVRRLTGPGEDSGAAAPAAAAPPDGPGLLRELQRLELRRYLLNQLLRDADVFGMAHSLEVRVPLLDHKVVEAALGAPPEVLLPGKGPGGALGPKALLVAALPFSLPRACTARPKMGFTFPFEAWMRGPWRPMLEEGLLGGGGVAMPLDASAVRQVWETFLAGRLHWSRPWSLWVLRRMGI